jgi:hypothetical protein
LSALRAFFGYIQLEGIIMNRDFKGIWIPKTIWLCTDLKPNEKILLSEIDSLDNEKGCFASNEYFSKFLQVDISTVTRAIAKLKKLQYIFQESFNGRERILRSNLEQCLGILPTLPMQNEEHINTYNNTSIINNTNVSDKTLNKNIPKENKFPKEVINIINIWNKASSPASKHNISRPTKTMKEIKKYYYLLKSGKFINHCTNITPEFLKSINIPKSERNRKWTDEEIIKVLKDCILQFEKGYYPFDIADKKRLLPKSLNLNFYNPYNSKCPSVFLKIWKSPPTYYEDLVKEKEDNNESITGMYLKELFNHRKLETREKNRIVIQIEKLKELHKEFCSYKIKSKRLDKELKRYEMEPTTFLTYFGSPDKCKPFFKRHIRFLSETYGDHLTTSKMLTTGTVWERFKNFYYSEYGITFEVNKKYMAMLLNDHEKMLERNGKLEKTKENEEDRLKELQVLFRNCQSPDMKEVLLDEINFIVDKQEKSKKVVNNDNIEEKSV